MVEIILGIICFVLIAICGALMCVVANLQREKNRWHTPVVPYDWDVDLAREWEEEDGWGC